MSRESGYYFVKENINSEWEPALWTGSCWWLGICTDVKDDELNTIHPTRIPTPDEVVTGEDAVSEIFLMGDKNSTYEDGIIWLKFRKDILNTFDITLKRKP